MSPKNQVNVLGIPFINKNKNEVESIIKTKILKKQNTFVITANPEIVMYAKQHPEYQKVVLSADFVVPDGIGIIMGAKILNHPLKERVTGYDLFIDLLSWGNQNSKKAFFVGAKPNVIKDLQEKIKNTFPKLIISGAYDGYFRDDKKIRSEIQRTQPDMIFVATGYPKQEEFIYKNRQLSNGFWIGVGGSFDVFSGSVKRAPRFWQQAHLEWLYRAIKQPSRYKRLLILPKYLLEVWHQKK